MNKKDMKTLHPLPSKDETLLMQKKKIILQSILPVAFPLTFEL